MWEVLDADGLDVTVPSLCDLPPNLNLPERGSENGPFCIFNSQLLQLTFYLNAHKECTPPFLSLASLSLCESISALYTTVKVQFLGQQH